MAMDYVKVTDEIIRNVGGVDPLYDTSSSDP